MKLNAEQGWLYFQDSTSASTATGSFSTAGENNLSYLLRNGIMLLEDLLPTQVKAEHTAIGANDRERIKRAFQNSP